MPNRKIGNSLVLKELARYAPVKDLIQFVPHPGHALTVYGAFYYTFIIKYLLRKPGLALVFLFIEPQRKRLKISAF